MAGELLEGPKIAIEGGGRLGKAQETDEVPRLPECPECFAPVAPGAGRCAECGTRLDKPRRAKTLATPEEKTRIPAAPAPLEGGVTCGHCGASMPKDAGFCDVCGDRR